MTRFLAPTIALALLGASAAQADTIHIRHNDLNLRSQAGKAELDRRIEGAARQLCQEAPLVGTRIGTRSEEARCKANVRAQVAAALPA